MKQRDLGLLQVGITFHNPAKHMVDLTAALVGFDIGRIQLYGLGEKIQGFVQLVGMQHLDALLEIKQCLFFVQLIPLFDGCRSAE